MEDLGAWLFGLLLIGGLLYLLAIATGYVLSAIYWALASFSRGLVVTLDGLLSAQVLPDLPAAAWAAWGALLGGVLGFWTIAPVYGMRRWRPALVWLVLAAMAGTAVYGAVTAEQARLAGAGSGGSPAPASDTAAGVARGDAGNDGDVIFRVNAQTLNVRVEFLGEVWLEVRADGKLVHSGTRRAQDDALVLTGSQLWMRLGRPQNVRLTINGQPQERLPAGDPRNVVIELIASPVAGRAGLPAPALSRPAEGAAGVSLQPTLSWIAVEGAASYRVQVAADTGFASLHTDQAGLKTTSITLGRALNAGTRYWWRVSAAGDAGTGPWSVASFITLGLPPAPVTAQPADGAAGLSTTPALSWSTVSGATEYHVQVARDDGFTDLAEEWPGVKGTSVTVSQALAGESRYWWRVAAVNAAGRGAWSAASSFVTVLTAPPAPLLSFPGRELAGVPRTPVLSWNRVAGATSYNVQVSRSPDFSQVVFERSVGDLAVRVTPELSPGEQYWWRVSASNIAGTGDWSEARRFTVREGEGS